MNREEEEEEETVTLNEDCGALSWSGWMVLNWFSHDCTRVSLWN